MCGTALVDKNFRHHEVGNDHGDDHVVILFDEVDAFEIFVNECYGWKTSRWWCINVVNIDISNGMEMALPGLARYPSIGESTRNSVDHAFNLLSEFVFLLLLGWCLHLFV